MEINKKRKKITARDKIQERKESRLSKKVKFDEKQRHFSKKLRGGGKDAPRPPRPCFYIRPCHHYNRSMSWRHSKYERDLFLGSYGYIT